MCIYLKIRIATYMFFVDCIAHAPARLPGAKPIVLQGITLGWWWNKLMCNSFCFQGYAVGCCWWLYHLGVFKSTAYGCTPCRISCMALFLLKWGCPQIRDSSVVCSNDSVTGWQVDVMGILSVRNISTIDQSCQPPAANHTNHKSWVASTTNHSWYHHVGLIHGHFRVPRHLLMDSNWAKHGQWLNKNWL